MRNLFAALALVACPLPGLSPQEPEKKPAVIEANADDAALIARQLPSYPLKVCPVSHEALDAMGKPKDVVHEGRLVRLCCKSCLKEFAKDPAPILKQIDEAVVQAQRTSYPLTTCPVSGEPLGGMGEPIDLVHGTRLVRLCCKGCLKGFQKDPNAAMAKVDAALIAQQRESYPLETCLVSGEALEGEGFDHLYGVRLTRFCCEKCVAAFEKEPAKFLAKLDSAKSLAPK
jgi:YHS domain-containing protein